MKTIGIASELREIAEKIEADYKGETVFLDSQNMSYGNMMPYLVEEKAGSEHDISCRGERLSHDKITIRARWIVDGGRGKGIFQTPDGKFWKVRGANGDAYDASSMHFEEILEGEVVARIRRFQNEKPKNR